MRYLAAALLLLIPAGPAAFGQDNPDRQANQAVIRVLGLDQGQTEKFRDWLTARRSALQPLQRSLREAQQALRMAAAGDNADATMVGELFLQRNEIQQNIAEVQRNARDGFADALMLSQQQRDMLGFLSAAFRYRQAAQLAQSVGILDPRPNDNDRDLAAPEPPEGPAETPRFTGNGGVNAEELTATLNGISADVSSTKDTVNKIARAHSIVVPEDDPE